MNTPEKIPLERNARRERLSILCALDRAELRLALRTRPASGGLSAMMNGGGLSHALTMTALLPGAAGRWSRRVAVGLRMLKRLA